MSLPSLQPRALSASLVLALAPALPGCGGADLAPTGHTGGSLVVTVDAVGTPIASLVLEVSAADITPPLVFNMTVLNGAAARTVVVPPGAARVLSVFAFDSTGAVTHEGAVTVDIVPGQNPPLAIPLTPRPGQLPVTVLVGPVTVTVSPATATLALGRTVQLTATVTAAGGAPLSLPVEWASRNPGLASVSGTGLVTALAAGQVDVAATSTGAVGSARITVGP